MDAGGLRSRIQSTLNSNADARRQAELDLKYVRPAQLDMSYSSMADGGCHRRRSNQGSPTRFSTSFKLSKTMASASPVCTRASSQSSARMLMFG